MIVHILACLETTAAIVIHLGNGVPTIHNTDMDALLREEGNLQNYFDLGDIVETVGKFFKLLDEREDETIRSRDETYYEAIRIRQNAAAARASFFFKI